MLAKARIINCLTNEVVICMFNPKEYTLSKQNSWQSKPTKGKTVAHLEFGGGDPACLELRLFFDTYEEHPPISRAGEDVRKYTQGLWGMMKVGKNKLGTTKASPPHCRFEWGTLWSFEAVIDRITQKFTFFAEDGTPLRAILDVTFRQIKDEDLYPRQNPTSGSALEQQLHIVQEGETLASIAYEEYGDATLWRHLALTNNIIDPRRLFPGQVLIIASIPLP